MMTTLNKMLTVLLVIIFSVLCPSETIIHQEGKLQDIMDSIDIVNLPRPQTEQFYQDVEPELEIAKKASKDPIILAFPPKSRLINDFFFNMFPYSPGHVSSPLTIQCRIIFFLPNVTMFDKGRQMDEKINILRSIENAMNSFGLDGRACVLKAICELEEFHIHTDDIFSEIVFLLLRLPRMFSINLGSYEEAQMHGSGEGDCRKKYSSCSFSIFKNI